jgi:transcriptional regulator with XRE-family HTH domain
MAPDVTPQPTIGSAIRTRRQQARLSQSALGRLVGRSQQWVAAVEGDRYLPDLDRVRLIAKHLGCEPADLIPVSDERKVAS